MESDWQEGKPPFMLECEVWARSNVRRGVLEGPYFRLLDCTHPLQNSVLDSDLIEQWRFREKPYINPPIHIDHVYEIRFQFIFPF
ncbi:hypothetical protein [Pandoraea commovens]|uniref:Uncharacterized protein n=1 Tax=Pandoraea commovens TaxID=2508289 RepID=A0A5E4VE08_9BURK|nr:hypothetical protein [Pandoraea commovens]VVE10371.1 hypothetical protein PCO31010_02616 [Pandoraea commovens]